jgi:hypothetical protein
MPTSFLFLREPAMSPLSEAAAGDVVGASDAAHAGIALARASAVKITVAMATLLRRLFAEARSAKAERNFLLFDKITVTSFLNWSELLS